MSSPLILAKTKDRLYFKLATASEKDTSPILCFSEKFHNETSMSIVDDFPEFGNIQKIAGIIGSITLKINTYVIIAKRVDLTGVLNGHKIFKVVESDIIPINRDIKPIKEEREYLKLLNQHLNNATLFFSYTYDLTNSSQRNNELLENSNGLTWKTADKRFFWNYYATDGLRNLVAKEENPQFNKFVIPMIYGYAKIVESTFNNHDISLGLITRRSIYRAGTRYFRRGIDEHGNVGNFNETEQILVVNKSNRAYDYYSFLQTRGSVPVYWAEVNNLKYKPKLFVSEQSSLEATKKHFDQQEKLYGENYLVNLVNQKGYELPVKQAYENIVDQLNDPKIHYVYFDFHHECRKMQWHRVKLLIDHLKKLGLTNNNYFHKICDGQSSKVVQTQNAIVRTNCMDCLDRTNVVQSVLAHWVLQNEFETAGVVEKGNPWESESKDLLFEFQNFWADNADAVSCAYSGTGALKTDFTRTGKRTYLGAFNDLVNSISRYYQNNLTDGPRQDSYDLFLGNFKPYEDSTVTPFADRRPTLIQSLPTVIYCSFIVLVATVFFPKDQNFTSTRNLGFFVGSVLTLLASFRYITKNGIQYVNWPKLCDLGFLTAIETADSNGQFTGVHFEVSSKFLKNVSKKD
ncbi:probable Phosphoinositide phosphatase SAC1 [Saccharomycodes ludwigii]|uniref:Probable Phosphoinositide phosphatase SAC1 n=1 Tax=Saccharomycodes ludwigii TaxID=36035 RepID=A0A376B4N6_9ASCO|nr:hypothetical protein SCDLUD_002232 [Saccharomycodes ludwigii]KAH3902410.1 hypothetical protein SCDLUD_002232 [Saccharomycodes ludwigii]SSD59667.1 probable Phosphoinositide phosphatase SAC1 [Saccharomycodes ludwigii]